MGYSTRHSGWEQAVWSLGQRQHWVVTHSQLVELGLHPQTIKHRVGTARLHQVGRGVYAVGRPELTRHGHWTAAVLSCGPGAALSHASAAALWGMCPERRPQIDVSTPTLSHRDRPEIIVHRRPLLAKEEMAVHEAIPVTAPARTLVDMATALGPRGLDAAINEADKRDLVDPVSLRAALRRHRGQRGVAILRAALDRHTFVLTDSALERLFLPLALRAGLPAPQTQQIVSGFRVDFYWPDIGLVVETDGLRYHRTPAQQAADRRRDQAHTANGLTPLRFTHAQVAHEPQHIVVTLRVVTRRLHRRVAT